MPDIDLIREYAARIMMHLEDAHLAALDIQDHGKLLDDMTDGFHKIRSELKAIDDVLGKANVLLKANTPN